MTLAAFQMDATDCWTVRCCFSFKSWGFQLKIVEVRDTFWFAEIDHQLYALFSELLDVKQRGFCIP